MRYIEISGARHNNLKGVNLKIPHNKMVVITGISGSGKSSLAFDVIYAEGQRRYLESLSTYARQFLAKLDKPQVDSIEGLTPTISIDQWAGSSNPRSTVGTVTEVYDYLRLLMAHAGKPYCPNCKVPIEELTVDEIAERLERDFSGEKISVLAPLVRGKKGDHRPLFQLLRRKGYSKVRVDGIYYYLDEEIVLNKHQRHDVDVLVDKLTVKDSNSQRLKHSLRLATELSQGKVLIIPKRTEEEIFFSTTHTCPVCGYSFPEISWRLFSFNIPLGACPTCYGLGKVVDFPEERITNPDKSIAQGAILPLGKPNFSYSSPSLSAFWRRLYDAAHRNGVSLRRPWRELTENERELILNGDGAYFEGVKGFLWRHVAEERYRWDELKKYGVEITCPTCMGYRLNRAALSVYLETSEGRYNIGELSDMPVSKLLRIIRSWEPPEHLKEALEEVISQIIRRLEFIERVGLGYLTLLRPVSTLSGGELRRIKLAEQLGSGLAGITYVLDEPTVGLHPRDVERLILSLRELVDRGNTVIVVEHDSQVIASADYLIELGPGAGEEGGDVVEAGPLDELMRTGKSLTIRYIRGEERVPVYRGAGIWRGLIEVHGISRHNLKEIDVELPHPAMVVITGVSGSGKSSLLEALWLALREALRGEVYPERCYTEVIVRGAFRDVMMIDQSPIGRTPRSTVATYTGVFDHIRALFAQLPEARKWGYTPSYFSYNLPIGRCEACKGEGFIKLDMAFLPSAYVKCSVCGGKRYSSDVLQVRFRGLSIADVLDLTVKEALELFRDFRAIRNKLQLLLDVGLDYLKLGQPTPTLSGGESQRIKLVSELASKRRENMIYLMDEPTTGLHPHDVAKLVKTLRRLVNMGNLVIVVEHNLDLIKSADWIIDLGPEAADEGGEVVFQGTLEEMLRTSEGYTAEWLRRYLSEELVEVHS